MLFSCEKRRIRLFGCKVVDVWFEYVCCMNLVCPLKNIYQDCNFYECCTKQLIHVGLKARTST